MMSKKICIKCKGPFIDGLNVPLGSLKCGKCQSRASFLKSKVNDLMKNLGRRMSQTEITKALYGVMHFKIESEDEISLCCSVKSGEGITPVAKLVNCPGCLESIDWLRKRGKAI